MKIRYAYKHKYRLGHTNTKVQALKDISNECGKDKLYTINYIKLERLVLKLREYKIEILAL